MSHLFKASLLLTTFFAFNKVVSLIRQTIIVREFGLTSEIDAFNVSNNLPDLVFSLFSGAALSLAFIPIFAEYIDEYGQAKSWRLFSKAANLLFIITAIFSLLFALFAKPLVASQIGIAPGFTEPQQDLVVDLMRIHLMATLIFSLSGLVMASLQANKHFLLPAVAPLLYNFGQIIGVVFLAPIFGIYGLAYGVVLGALMHLGVQIPGMFRYQFRYFPTLDMHDVAIRKVLSLMGPRILTVFLIQAIFLSRDNLASRLTEGSVTELTYGHFIMQVPETLIGTAIATALLPTLSQFINREKKEAFEETLNHAMRIIVAATVVIAVLLAITLPQFIKTLFGFNALQTEMLVWTTRAFLVGLIGHSLLEVVARAFYAKQDAKTPLVATSIRAVAFFVLALLLFSSFGAVGIAIADSIAVIVEVVLLLTILTKAFPRLLHMPDTIVRTVGAAVTAGLTCILVIQFFPGGDFIRVIIAVLLGGIVALVFVIKELRMLIKL